MAANPGRLKDASADEAMPLPVDDSPFGWIDEQGS
jgi:hypothetical protein